MLIASLGYLGLAGCGGKGPPEYDVLYTIDRGGEHLQVYDASIQTPEVTEPIVKEIMRAEFSEADAAIAYFCEAAKKCYDPDGYHRLAYTASNEDGLRWLAQNFDPTHKLQEGEVFVSGDLTGGPDYSK